MSLPLRTLLNSASRDADLVEQGPATRRIRKVRRRRIDNVCVRLG